MFRHTFVQKFFRRAVLPLMMVVVLMQPLGVSAATAELYGYQDYGYPTWTRFTTPRTGSGTLLRFDQWSGPSMWIGYRTCSSYGDPTSFKFSTVSGWANIGYPSGTFCISTRANSPVYYGPNYPFTGVIEY